MPYKFVVFESFDQVNKRVLERHLKGSVRILVVEPFVAYHNKKVKVFLFPKPLPGYVEQLLQEKKLELLSAQSIDARTIYFLATNKAAEIIEAVFPYYREEHKELSQYTSDTLKSSKAENVFKKELCKKMAEFYSANIMFERIVKVIGTESILFYPGMDIKCYLQIKTLLSKSKQSFFDHSNIQFPVRVYISSFLENLKKSLFTILMLSTQTLVSGVLGRFQNNSDFSNPPKNYTYGIAITSLIRQLSDNLRGPKFLIDNKKIKTDDVVYFSLSVKGIEGRKKKLQNLDEEVVFPPKPGQYFSNYPQWRKLLWLVLKNNVFKYADEAMELYRTFFYYFSWQKVLSSVKIRHFITHNDFDSSTIGRNIALNQAGVETWYYTASMNSSYTFKNKENKMLYPGWTYLNYDHFVTWDETIARYFNEHPIFFKQTHVVGCLWSEHIQEKDKTRNLSSDYIKKDSFVLAVFDSGYAKNGICDYREGLAFAKHIYELVELYPDIYVFFKEKTPRDKHVVQEPKLGPKLMDLYDRMSEHPRITICPDNADSSELISISDMVVSFPFTSTTFEALSVNRPAIWHDPCGCYRDTPYGKIGEVTTHNYEGLKAKVLEIKNLKPGTYQNPFPANSPLMDPFRDGKAIDRFRDLLISS